MVYLFIVVLWHNLLYIIIGQTVKMKYGTRDTVVSGSLTLNAIFNMLRKMLAKRQHLPIANIFRNIYILIFRSPTYYCIPGTSTVWPILYRVDYGLFILCN